MRSAIFLAGCLAVLAAVLVFDARTADAANVTGGGSSSSCSGDINAGCSQVTGLTHTASGSRINGQACTVDGDCLSGRCVGLVCVTNLSTATSPQTFAGTLPVANGGTGDATTGWSSAARPASPDSRNDEFDGALSGWTTTIGSCAPSGTIDPLSAFNTANIYHTSQTYWPGWFTIQSTEANVVCGIGKAVTINTNDLVWTRIRTTMPSSGIAASSATAEICIGDALPPTHYVCAQAWNESGTPTLRILSDGAGSATITGTNGFLHSTGTDILGIQKVATTYYVVYGSLAQLSYSVSLTNANAMSDVLLEAYNGNAPTFVPGNPIVGFDYIRFINSTTALPW